VAHNQKILKELDQLEALADTVKERCYRLRETLGVVSTTPTGRKARYAASSAKVLANRNRNIQNKRS
jgi:hypothetical protein